MDRSARIYPMGVVEELTGLTGRQIRYYEQQGLVSPRRSPGNQRLFSPADVDRLKQIKDLLAQGLTISGIHHWFAGEQPTRPPRRGEGPEQARPQVPVRLPEQNRSAQPDIPHTPPPIQQGRRLTSLYPVNHQGELNRRLQAARDTHQVDKDT